MGTAGVGAWAAVGCGDDDDDGDQATPTSPAGTSTTSTSSSATASASATADAAKAVEGSWYSAHQVNAGTTLDMHRELYRQNIAIVSQAYNNLIAWDDVGKGTMVGEIAEGVEQEDDLTYTFTLRSGVKWQDKAPADGRALTMDDIRWNFERQRASKLADGSAVTNFYRAGTIYAAIDNVDYVDEQHFTVKLKQPKAPWLATMCDEFNVIMLKEIGEAIEQDFGTFDPKYIVGTGPYMIDAYTLAKGAHMTRTPDYWLKKAVGDMQYVDEIYFSNLGTDVNAVRTAFEGKQIDLLTGVTSKDVIDSIVNANKDVIKVQVPNPNSNLEFGYAWKNSPAFSNPQIRQAIFIAVDRQLVGQQQFQGLARPNPAIPWAFTDWSLPQTELLTYAGYRTNKDEDIKEARQLWEAGGAEALGNELFEFVIVDTADQAIKEWFPAMLNKNLNTNKFSVKTIPVSSLLEYDRSQNSVGYLGGWDQWTSPDPHSAGLPGVRSGQGDRPDAGRAAPGGEGCRRRAPADGPGHVAGAPLAVSAPAVHLHTV
jgi:ABC-type transport system substrate-binding protein